MATPNPIVLNKHEADLVTTFTERLILSRDERKARVDQIAAAVANLELSDQMVIVEYARFLSGKLDPINLDKTLFAPRIYFRAPGVYLIHDPELRQLICEAGELVSLENIFQAKELLGYPKGYATKTADHLYRWVAARYPGSEAAADVDYYGTKTGMRHDRDLSSGNYKNFNSRDLVFSKEVVDEYIRLHCGFGDQTFPAYSAVIFLARSTDNDFEQALSLMSPQAAKRARSKN